MAESTNRDIERQFDRAMTSIYERALIECGYKATRFLQMIQEDGGFHTAKTLLHTPGLQDGFQALWEHGRLDLTMEALILRSPWNKLFTDDEKEIARKRLRDCGYTHRSEI
ncbi:MAG: hypothetical protein ACE144_12915 [Thermodesulfobacteriota bacterium]